MTDQTELESLYQEAQSALKSKDYDRASGLLKQILVIDENYKDTSRLLAQTVALRRRRWYNDPRLWGTVGVMAIIALGFVLAPKISGLFTRPAPVVSTITVQPTRVIPPTDTPIPTETLVPIPTSVPLAWKRINIGQEFERDTVTAIVIDPKDRDVLYAGMKNAGIYKSIDGGLSWRPAHHGLVNAHITSLLIGFQNPQFLYAGTMAGIYKTEDSGENWYKINEGTHVLMYPQNSSHLYARNSDYIYESTDQGNTWKTIYSSTEGCPGKIYSWAIHPTDGRSLFITAGEGCEWGVYVSNNRGDNWTLVNKIEIPPGANMIDYGVDKLAVGLDGKGNLDIQPGGTAAYNSAGVVYFYWDSALRKTGLDKDQWITLGKPDIGIVTTITISAYDPNTIYVGGQGITVSRDGGLTWTKLNNGLGSGILQLDAGAGGAPILYVQPGECDTWGLVRDRFKGSLYISTNGGNTWNLVVQEGCHLIKDADGLTLYRMGEPSGWSSSHAWRGIIWRSKDGGRSWQRALTPNFIQTIVAHTNQTGLLYGFTHDPNYQTRINPMFQEEEYFQSKDYGHTWKRMDPVTTTKPCYGSTLQFIDKYRPMAIDPRDGNHVFVIDNGTLLESHDNCDTTKTFATAPNKSMNSIAFDPNKSDTIYAGTDEGAYISFDSGITWNQINDGLLGATVVYSIVVDKDSNVNAATPYGIFKLENK